MIKAANNYELIFDNTSLSLDSFCIAKYNNS